ncbi:MAG: phosphopentomutase [Gammaproteobacteria bacterium]|nr:phosphopentomutase [Gammaproteobacteria bacterium]
MTRAFVLVMDSLGIGATADAEQFGDSGANTFGHIAEQCSLGLGDKPGVRKGPLQVPNFLRFGLGRATQASSGSALPGIATDTRLDGAYGYCAELSRGKDTPSGHWEIAGLPVDFNWTHFPNTQPSLPSQLTTELIIRAGLPGILGNSHSSGTVILEKFGQQHIDTGKPIVYTSADSVIQIAAHEIHFGLPRLLEVCRIARELADYYNVGRVIARPFIGESSANFQRTGNRRDFTTPPHRATLLDKLQKNGDQVIAIGKVDDIFAHRGITEVIKADGNMALFDATLKAATTAPPHSLIFTNFVDFDMLYGHRRDLPGYANALEQMDRRLPQLEARLKPGDLMMITADHGCDPTWPGSDHTREHIPILMLGPGVVPRALGKRNSFADIGQSLASFFGLKPLTHGESFLISPVKVA